jgi:hypothetical protein
MQDAPVAATPLETAPALFEREESAARVEAQDRLIERYRRRERWAP